MNNLNKFLKKIVRKATNQFSIHTRAESILSRAIELGKKGRFKVAPEFISISATENCNLKCVMCLGHAGMSGPKLSLEEAEMLFCTLADKDVKFGQPKMLDMTAGEPTLNPNLANIYRKFKEIFPDAKISIISNATIPISGSTREAFELADRIGLSMDGATEETYERIRTGASYKNVVRNVREIAEMKKLGVNCNSLSILFVAMDQNIHELAEMVRLTHTLGIPCLFAQVSEVRGETPFNGEELNVSLSLTNAELAPIVVEAKEEAIRLGVELQLTSRFDDAVNEMTSTQSKPDGDKKKQLPNGLDVAIKTCNIPWVFSPRISQNKDGIYPTMVCCHMPNVDLGGNLQNRPEFKDKSIIEIFNSKFYWDIRSRLLDGTLAKKACMGCQYYNSTQWNKRQLRELENAVSKAERNS